MLTPELKCVLWDFRCFTRGNRQDRLLRTFSGSFLLLLYSFANLAAISLLMLRKS